MEVLKVENVSFSYQQEPILRNIHFSLQPGEFVGLVGNNGAGKSTLFGLLLGELLPEPGGSIYLFGEKLPVFQQWHRISYVPQSHHGMGIFFPATVEEVVCANLFHQIGLFGMRKKVHWEKAAEALRLVGMEEYRCVPISKLSGGQWQRVLLARAFVNKPQMILLDEPASGVDAPSTRMLYQLLNKVCHEQGIAVLMISHDHKGLAEFVHKTFLLEQGRVRSLSNANLSI